jgi:hypothetical protein
MEAAFDRLRHYSHSRNLRLAEVAHRIAARELDPTEVPASRSSRTRT